MKTHYDVLEISKEATLLDIKKSYRRLALKHHPDRNNGSAESTEKFKEISEAYTILSNTANKRQYDMSLKCPSSKSQSNVSEASTTSSQGISDPFQQFDDLFRNDPFFHSAFEDLDEQFAKRFDTSKDDNRDDLNDYTNDVGPLFCCGGGSAAKRQPKKNPWTQWIVDKLGIEMSVTSYSHEADGSVLATSYMSKPGKSSTNKKTRTYVEDGRQVTIMSMEKDGNKIEDKFVGGDLVERRVNGSLEPTSRVAAG
mmetsp:Transcript_17362/g.37595  ORF Transcript_17362/g.37595 Transcript_17362/m.37595 type:complete len:254 (+) Transcript_17362:37-798(+)|eukprot:g9898.t1 g9898   contig4:825592-826451(+)